MLKKAASNVMPKQVTLRLHTYYYGEFLLSWCLAIQGTLTTDIAYRDSIREMMRFCGCDLTKVRDAECNVAKDWDIVKFMTYRKMPAEPLKSFAESCVSFWKENRYRQREIVLAAFGIGAAGIAIAASRFFR